MGEWGPTATVDHAALGLAESLADGGMGANRNPQARNARRWRSLADGGMGANRNMQVGDQAAPVA